MGRESKVRNLLAVFSDKLDQALDADGSEILVRIAVMECRDSLRNYEGLHDVGRCRKAIERFVNELQEADFPDDDDLWKPVQKTCERMIQVLRKA